MANTTFISELRYNS